MLGTASILDGHWSLLSLHTGGAAVVGPGVVAVIMLGNANHWSTISKVVNSLQSLTWVWDAGVTAGRVCDLICAVIVWNKACKCALRWRMADGGRLNYCIPSKNKINSIRKY